MNQFTNLAKEIGKKYLKVTFGTSCSFGVLNAIFNNIEARTVIAVDDFINSDEDVFDSEDFRVKIKNENVKIKDQTIDLDIDINKEVNNFRKFARENSDLTKHEYPKLEIWSHTGKGFVDGAVYGLKIFASPVLYPYSLINNKI